MICDPVVMSDLRNGDIRQQSRWHDTRVIACHSIAGRRKPDISGEFIVLKKLMKTRLLERCKRLQALRGCVEITSDYTHTLIRLHPHPCITQKLLIDLLFACSTTCSIYDHHLNRKRSHANHAPHHSCSFHKVRFFVLPCKRSTHRFANNCNSTCSTSHICSPLRMMRNRYRCRCPPEGFEARRRELAPNADLCITCRCSFGQAHGIGLTRHHLIQPGIQMGWIRYHKSIPVRLWSGILSFSYSGTFQVLPMREAAKPPPN